MGISCCCCLLSEAFKGFFLSISDFEGKERIGKKVSLLLWICMVSNSEEILVLRAHFGLCREGKGRRF